MIPVDLLRLYVERHNEGVRTSNWRAMLDLFAPDATITFHSIEFGPLHGRDEIARAFAVRPPDDELVLVEITGDGATANAGYT